MFQKNSERLGFSDLTEDEGFLIVLYRDWRSRGPTKAIGEHALANLLKKDKIYASLNEIFITFRAIEKEHDDELIEDVILTETEELILTNLSVVFQPQSYIGSNETKIHVRPATEIFRSGHDKLHDRIGRSYW